MSIECRITELKAGLDLGIRRHGASLTPDREARVFGHEGFLTLSWQGDLDYWRRIDLDCRVQEQRKAPGNGNVSRAKLRRLNIEPVRKHYADKRKLLYIFERVVFFKTSHLIPKTLQKLTTECDDAYREAPLHRYVVVERCQKPADKGAEPVFGCWQIQPVFHLGGDETATALLAEIYPKTVQDRLNPVFLWLIAVALTAVLVSGIALARHAPALEQRVLSFIGRLDPAREAELAGLERLRARLAQMEETYQTLRENVEAGRVGEAATATRLAGLDLEISGLWERLAALPLSGPAMDRVGEAACLPVRHEGDRVFPTFLYAITLDRDATLSLRPLVDGMESARDHGFTAVPDQASFQLEIPAFESLVSSTSSEAQARSCRHYVLLIENDPQDAGRYIAGREAVERHFYVFRP